MTFIDYCTDTVKLSTNDLSGLEKQKHLTFLTLIVTFSGSSSKIIYCVIYYHI